MKKHFLLLLLMTLLPLAGWAVDYDVTVTLGTINKEYGTADPDLTVSNFSITSTGGDLTKAELRPYLTYQRVTQGENVGDALYYTVRVDGGGTVTKGEDHYNVVIANNGFVNIFKKNISNGIVVEDIASRPYDGTAYEPTLTVKYTAFNDEKLVLGTDYTVEFTDNISKGTATATLTGIGNYEGTLVANYTITAGVFTVAFAEAPTFTYNGQAQVPTYNVMRGETSLATEDYTITYWTDETRNVTQVTDPTDAKTYYIKVAGVNNYEGTTVTTLSYEIAKKSLADGDVTAVVKNDYIKKTYKGEAITGYAASNLKVQAYVGTDNVLTLNSTMYDRKGYENNINVPAADAADDQKPRFKVVGKGNFTGERYVYFNIVPRPLDDVTISDVLVADQPYTGLQITPSTENMITYSTQTLVAGEDKDYTVAYGPNKNVVKDGEGTVVNGGTITITGTGNYSGTVEKSFKITPAELTVNAKDFSKKLGTADPTSDELAAGNYYEITGYVNEETAEKAGVTGAPTFAIATHTEVTGSFDVISIASVGNLTAANYSFTKSETKANLIIGQAVATIAATAAEETYGYKLPTLVDNFAAGALGFTATGMLAGAEEIDKLTFTVTDAEGNEYAAGAMLKAGEYTITPSAAHATNDSYVFTYTTAKLTIKPYKLTIAAQDQAIDYGTAPVVCPTSWANTYVKFLKADGSTIGKTDFEALYGVWKEDFIENTEWVVAPNHPVAEPGTIKVNLKDDPENPTTQLFKNFTVTTVPGSVTYTSGIPTDLAMKSMYGDAADDEFTKISTYHGQSMHVTITVNRTQTLESGTKYMWNGEDWNAFILPFDITPKELSEAFGYAIVNVVNPAATKENNVAFKLQMSGTIPANTPFMLKNYEPVNGLDGTTDKVVDLGYREIVAPGSAEVSIEAGEGIKFIGRYTKDVIDYTKTNAYYYNGQGAWRHLKSTSTNTWTIAPFNAYMLMPATDGAREVTFTFEEPDGSVTAIKSVSVDESDSKQNAEGWYNLNGVKLQGVPAQKGVYIKDGKKVVIK